MSVQSMLIRMARAVVQSVIAQMMKQFQVVEEQAFNPMRAMIEAVTSGIWRGEGANAFVEEISSLMIPGVGRVMEQISTTATNVRNAASIIDRADQEVQRLVGSRLNDAFRFY